jgi:hypothetical protein
MEELVDGIWRWTAPHPEWRRAEEWTHEVACFALEHEQALLLVDPLAPPTPNAFWAELDDMAERSPGVVHVLITMPYHVRSTEDVYARYRGGAEVTVWGHPAVRRRLTRRTPLEVIEPGAPLPLGARAFPIGSPRRHEMPLHLPSHRALALGDSIVGVDGGLRIWETVDRDRSSRWYRERLLPTLEPLRELDIDHALVTHGPPAIGNGREELSRALEREPWRYRD